MSNSANKMIPIATCPKCKAEFWLLDEEMYEPGAQPAKSPGKAAVTFICCGNPQSVPPGSVIYRVAAGNSVQVMERRLAELTLSVRFPNLATRRR
jgi:hypothetical protein